MKKILFNGFYGFKNTGDDSFLEVVAWGAKKYWNIQEVFFYTKSLPILKNKSSNIRRYNSAILDRVMFFF